MASHVHSLGCPPTPAAAVEGAVDAAAAAALPGQGCFWAAFGTCLKATHCNVEVYLFPRGAIRPEWTISLPPPPGAMELGNRTAAGQGALLETFRGPRIVVLRARMEGPFRRDEEFGFSSLTRPVKVAVRRCLFLHEALTLAINAS